ncbi:hypothetical protein GCM10012275_40590 [Longimycelium tulufanense]|uniref:Uncharacterized protein n=1 Tax=Longimycelium tulufanense TaxID=907463 RepID=A0A8J3CIC8_9PSEU|nr:hypothetical protein GCM10012275_40590 [Longimycelium tulufanense]
MRRKLFQLRVRIEVLASPDGFGCRWCASRTAATVRDWLPVAARFPDTFSAIPQSPPLHAVAGHATDAASLRR